MNQLPTKDEVSALLRSDLSSFIMRCFLELNPSTEYMHNWHIDLIASKLNEVRLGTCKRLIINIPPRNMKSICASVAFPAWLLGHNPSLNIIFASYGQDLADKLGIDCRKVMQSDWYQHAFQNTRIAFSKKAANDFMTTKHGSRMATSVGGVMTGRGAEVLIIDDPVKPEDAFSDTTRAKANEWFESTAYSRLNSKKEGAIIIIMQRLHMDDLTGHVIEKEAWDLISLPAIAEEQTTHTYETMLGTESITREVGEPLHAERESLGILHTMRATTGEYNFAGQYQQSPTPDGGAIIKRAWLRYIPQHEFPALNTLNIIQSWDTASKATEISDYSVCTTWGIKDKNIYLLDVWRERVEFPDLKRAVIALYQQYKPAKVFIEDKSSGMSLIQDLKDSNIYGVVSCKPIGDKVMRLHEQSVLFESGQVFLLDTAPWLADFVKELTSFPACKHDDQVDSVTQALAEIRKLLDEPGGVYAYYKMLHAEMMRNKPAGSL